MMKYLMLFFVMGLLTFTGCSNDHNKHDLKNGADSVRVSLENLNLQISDHPGDPLLYDQRAKQYLMLRQTDNALKDVNKAISLDSGNSDFFVTLSDIISDYQIQFG